MHEIKHDGYRRLQERRDGDTVRLLALAEYAGHLSSPRQIYRAVQMPDLHTPVFVYEPQQTPDVDFDTLGRFRLHFIATDGSSVFVRMNRDMLKNLGDQIAKAVEAT